MKISEYNLELSDAQHPMLVKEKVHDYPDKIIKQSKDIADMINTCCHLNRQAEEHGLVVMFNVQLKPLGIFEISHGTIDRAIISPREIYIRALLIGAKYIAVCHNHPSGNPTPSKEDDECCNKINDAGKLLDIPLLDFIIFAKNEIYGYCDHGRLT